MDFRLTDEQQQIRDMVREFGESEIKPHIAEWDEAQHFPIEVFRKAGELGLLGVIFPEEYGGASLSYIDYVNVIEELGAVESGFALSVAAHNSLCTGHIYLAGNDQQKKKWMPKLTSGAYPSPRPPSAWRAARMTRRATTPSSALRSANRSPSSRPSNSCSPTWRRRSTRRGC